MKDFIKYLQEVKAGKHKTGYLKYLGKKLSFGKIEEVKKIGNGACATCYRAKDMVVLYSNAYTDTQLAWLVKQTMVCKQKGINILPILHYYHREEFDQDYPIYAILQPYCPGKHLYTQLKVISEYEKMPKDMLKDVLDKAYKTQLEESKTILEMKDNVLVKFIRDYFQIEQHYIRVDCYNPENFIVNSNGINFIDLSQNISQSIPSADEIAQRITNLLVGTDYQYKFNQQFSSSECEVLNKTKKKIVEKVFKVFDSLHIPHPSTKEYNKKVIIYPKIKPIYIE